MFSTSTTISLKKASIKALVQELAVRHGFEACESAVNSADDPSTGAIYLTVTGTSAKAGDDGEVGRGNRVNGLITPGRPMSLEAAAGKNPVTHVGKIYNVLARDLTEALTEISQIARANCVMLSRIAAPVSSPAVLQLKLATRDQVPAAQLRPRVEEIADRHLSRIPKLIDEFVAGAIDVF